MRLDARTMPIARRFAVWDVPRCRRLTNVVWVDDRTARYGQLLIPIVIVEGTAATRIVQVKRIHIALEAFLVLIDPVDDDATDEAAAVASRSVSGSGPSPESPCKGNSNLDVGPVQGSGNS
jgi:hypothetical protein